MSYLTKRFFRRGVDMRIVLKDKCAKQTITRGDGKAVAEMLAEAWNKDDKITIDFSNILIASVSFLDEAFGKLAFEYPKEILTQKLAFDNMDPYDRALLNDILKSRYHQKELGLNAHSKARKRKKSRNSKRQTKMAA